MSSNILPLPDLHTIPIILVHLLPVPSALAQSLFYPPSSNLLHAKSHMFCLIYRLGYQQWISCLQSDPYWRCVVCIKTREGPQRAQQGDRQIWVVKGICRDDRVVCLTGRFVIIDPFQGSPSPFPYRTCKIEPIELSWPYPSPVAATPCVNCNVWDKNCI